MRLLDVRAIWARAHEVGFRARPTGILRYHNGLDLEGPTEPLTAAEDERIRYARQTPTPPVEDGKAKYEPANGNQKMALAPDEVGQIVEALEGLDWVKAVKQALSANTEQAESDVPPSANFGACEDDREGPQDYGAETPYGAQTQGSAGDPRWPKPGGPEARYAADPDPKAALTDEANRRKRSGQMAGPQSYGAALADKMDREGPLAQQAGLLSGGSLAPRGEASGEYHDLRTTRPTKRQPRGTAEGNASLRTTNFARAAQPSTAASINYSKRLEGDRAQAERSEQYHRPGSFRRIEAHEAVVMADTRLRASRKDLANEAMGLALREGLSYENALVKLGGSPPPSLVPSC